MAPYPSGGLSDVTRRALVDEPAQAFALSQAIESSYLAFDTDSVACWSRRALAVDQYTVLPLVALGLVARSRGSNKLTLSLYRRAAALDPGYEPAWTGLGATALDADCDDEAVAGFQRALSIAPTSAVAAKNLAEALRLIGQPGQGVRLARRAVALAPSLPQSHYNLGIIEYDLERLDEAARHLNRTLALFPNDADALYALGTVDLQRDRLGPGWMGYEARWDQRAAPQMRPFGVPRWNGGRVSGALLLWGEQGLGDEILMSSVIQDAEACADRVVVECDRRLVSILTRSLPRVVIAPRHDPPDPATQARDIAAHCPFSSLPLYLRTELTSFPRSAFLNPDPGRLAKWRTWLDSLEPGLKVGFAWRSSRSDRQARYIHPPIAIWRPLFSVPGVTWIPMQYGNFHHELTAVTADARTVSIAQPSLDLFNDLEGALALGASLDLMISTGTTAAYIPAAAGTETWLAAPFRSFIERLDAPICPWFARTRVFSVDIRNNWAAVARTIAAELEVRASDRV